MPERIDRAQLRRHLHDLLEHPNVGRADDQEDPIHLGIGVTVVCVLVLLALILALAVGPPLV